MRIRVDHTLGGLERDMRQIPARVAKDMGQTVRRAAIVGNSVARDNARRSAGTHGKRYPSSFTWEMRRSLFGGAGFTAEYGPISGRPQGGMSFEYGSRNQPPHLDLNKSADLIGPAFAQDVREKMDNWFWPGSG